MLFSSQKLMATISLKRFKVQGNHVKAKQRMSAKDVQDGNVLPYKRNVFQLRLE